MFEIRANIFYHQILATEQERSIQPSSAQRAAGSRVDTLRKLAEHMLHASRCRYFLDSEVQMYFSHKRYTQFWIRLNHCILKN